MKEKPRLCCPRPLQPAARVQVAGDRTNWCCRCSVCACLLLRPVRGCAPMSRAAVLRGCRAIAHQRNCVVLWCARVLCCAAQCATCAVFKVSRVPYTIPSVSTRSASSARCALRCVPCSTVSTVGLPPRCSWHQQMPCLSRRNECSHHLMSGEPLSSC